MLKLKIILRPSCMAVLLLLSIARPSLAGKFFVTSVWPVFSPPTLNTVHVRAGANATYLGTTDNNDKHALLQTKVCTVFDKQGTEICGFGLGVNDVKGPWIQGYTITCNTTQCMGQQYISKPCCNVHTVDLTPKAGVTIFHVNSPDIDTRSGSTTAVACKQCSSQCNAGGSAGTAFVLPIRGQIPQSLLDLPQIASEFSLGRVDTQGQITYLMDEWTLASSDGLTGNFGESTDTSSLDLAAWLAAQNSASLSLATATTQAQDWTALVVMAPPHPNVQRSIPLPEAGLHRTWLSGANEPGLLAVRLDYSEDRTPLAFEVLHQEGAVGQREVNFVRNNLFLRYKSSKKHRTILYAVIRFDGEVEIESSVTLLPQCCGPQPPTIPVDI